MGSTCRNTFILFLFATFLHIPEGKTQTVLASSTARHTFSDAFKNDIFKLTLTGSSLVESNATLEIQDPNGKSIYTEEFTADMLLEPEKEGAELTAKQKEDLIRKRVSEFFKEENFYRPAIDLKDEFDIDYNPDLKAWQLIRGDRTAIGFEYLFGADSKKKIAWVKQWKKMVIYWATEI